MTNSYEDMMGTAMDPGDHPSTNMPTATQHYAGDVVPIRPVESITNITARLGQARNEMNQQKNGHFNAGGSGRVIPIK